MKNILTIAQLIIAVLLIVVILVQNQSAGMGGIFGGSGGGVSRSKRGPEKTLFILTIILSILFLGLSIAVLFV